LSNNFLEYDGINAIKRAWEDFQKWDLEQKPRSQQERDERSTKEHNDQEALERKRPEDREHTYTGAMIFHYVISEVDRGEPMVVEYVEFKSGETLEDLTDRMHNIEHVLIIRGTGLAIAKLWEERRSLGD
jgi:Formyl transferase